MAISTGAAIIGGSLGSALLGSRSSRRAAGAQTDSNNAAIEEQRRQFEAIMGMTAPQREIGNQSMNAIAQLLGLQGFNNAAPQQGQGFAGLRGGPNGLRGGLAGLMAGGSGGLTGGAPGSTNFNAANALANLPGNEVIVNDMMRRIQQSSPTTGGNVLAALGDRVGGFQSDRLFGSLFQLAGFGPSGTNMATNAAGNMGNSVSSLMQNSGMANASGIMGQGQAMNSGLQNILQWYAMQDMLGGSGGSRGGGGGGGGFFGRGA